MEISGLTSHHWLRSKIRLDVMLTSRGLCAFSRPVAPRLCLLRSCGHLPRLGVWSPTAPLHRRKARGAFGTMTCLLLCHFPFVFPIKSFLKSFKYKDVYKRSCIIVL